MLSWASERMKMLYFTFSEPDTFLLIASWTPSFVFPSLNPLAWRSLFLILLRLMKVCRIHCAVFLSKSPEDLFPNIYCSHSLTVNPVQNSIHYCLHFSDVRIECLLTVFSISNIWLVKKKSCRWPPWDIDALIDHCVWSLIYWQRLSWAEWCACTWISSICVVRQGLISKFLTVNDFILKPDGSQFIGKLCLIRSYQHRI